MSRIQVAFSTLIATQAAHSIEEYTGRLWESFPPARVVTGLVSSDRELGFVVINTALIAVGLLCALFPVRQEWPSGHRLVGFWVGLETINGVGHLAWTLRQGGYTPGVLTAPILIAVAVYLGIQLRRGGRAIAPAA
jgi:hypothetical protein